MAAERWIFPLCAAAFVSLLVFFYAIIGLTASSVLFSRPPALTYVRCGAGHPPSFAYYISGARGDRDRVLRLLLAVYHPRNRYLLHLSADASGSERTELAVKARLAIPAIRAFGNVDVLGKPDAMSYTGSSELAATLHAASVLLKLDGGWDWFVTLSATDYPLMTQDVQGIFFDVSDPKVGISSLQFSKNVKLDFSLGDSNIKLSTWDLNFIEHTSDLGWKEYHRVQPIVVDSGIYLARRTKIFSASEGRSTPDAFRFFSGSPWVILSRSFMEYCVLGWENLPRTLLMYFTNVALSQEGYFHSVVCNSPEFNNTTVNNDLRFMLWDNPPGMQPHFLNVTNFEEISESGLPFARQFHKDDPVLDKIDEKILGRWHHQAVPGAWCSAKRSSWMEPCSKWSNVNIVKPGLRAKKFAELMKKLLDEWKSQLNSCK